MEKNREINLFDMFFCICLKWRVLICVGVLFAVIAAGISYEQSYKASLKAKVQNENNKEITLDDLAAKLSYEEAKDVDVYLRYKKVYDELTYYKDNSPLMTMDFDDFCRGEVTCYIDNGFLVEHPIMSKVDNTIAFVNAYKGLVNTDEFAAELYEVLEGRYEQAYVLELIDGNGLYAGETTNTDNPNEGIFSLSFYAEDVDTCKEIGQLISRTILNHSDEMEATLGEHEISVIQNSASKATSIDLMLRQRDTLDRLSSCSTAMSNLSSKFTDAQKEYVDTYIKESNEKVETDNEPVNVPGQAQVTVKGTVNVQMTIIGFVLGIVLMMCLYACTYITNDHIRLEDDYELCFAAKLLGNVPISEQKKKWFGFIDRLFVKLRHFNKHYFETEEALDMVAANIRIAMNKVQKKKLMITGTICGEEEKKAVQALASRLKKDGIELAFEKPILYDAEALENLVEIGHVLLIEKAEKSLRPEIAREIEICAQQEVNLIGCVVVY